MFTKKFVSGLVAATALSSVLLIPQAFAQGTGDNPEITEDKPTQEQIEAIPEKEELLERYIESKYEKFERSDIKNMSESEYPNIAANKAGEKYRGTIGVDAFEQETNYYCGPATVKQVLHFINGKSKSQDQYAKELGTTKAGTDFSLIDELLNKHQDRTKYVYKTHSSDEKHKFLDKIEYGIESDYPVLMDLHIKPSYMPIYNKPVEGHILNASGYDWRDWELRLTDPFDQNGKGRTLGNTWHPADGVWKANQAHFRQAVIW
ncbi:hypothetical protein E8L90_18880 [Brevibacillus antibioticus]|uniref:Peptidase C39-like domain-containing protein n=1 Tax=Brevibacillus antibioticus TaxID=2570228 RepID=A0A4V5TJ00_9BACL|nr:C39 family peptidase [Brevibacillus antibioticus]TKI57353.1 hypothetical protein E8L90_18880 [Brevibacillus antibioticus]